MANRPTGTCSTGFSWPISAEPGTLPTLTPSLVLPATWVSREPHSPRLSTATARAVEKDRQDARRLQVHSIPTLIVRETGTRLFNGPREDLAAQLRTALRLTA